MGGMGPPVHHDLSQKCRGPRLDCKASFSLFPFLLHVHWFPRAAVIKCHQLRAGNNRTRLSGSSGGRRFRNKVAAGCLRLWVVRGNVSQASLPPRTGFAGTSGDLYRHLPRARPLRTSSSAPKLALSATTPVGQDQAHPDDPAAKTLSPKEVTFRGPGS